jgi:hypothetical protein
MRANRRINRRAETVETLLLTLLVIALVGAGAVMAARRLDKPQSIAGRMAK